MRGEPYQKFNNIYNEVDLSEFSDNDKKFKHFMNLNHLFGVTSPTNIEGEGLEYTIGYEIETVMGRLDPNDFRLLNLKAVHDGSLRDENGNDPTGGEYVTGVLYGDTGFKQLYDICRVLNKNCDIDHRAGVHVHIGNLNWSEEDILYSYILAQMIEDEQFEMLPKSRKTNSYCKPIKKLFNENSIKELLNVAKSKSYSYKPLVAEMYNELFRYVSSGEPQSPRFNSNSQHPLGFKCGYDKSSQRYCWLNYVSLIFNTRSNNKFKTLEIRSHSATMNYTKIKNWAKIWMAFCNFVSREKLAILTGKITINGKEYPVSLESIVLYSYPRKGKELVDYIQSRKKLFTKEDESVDFSIDEYKKKTLKKIIIE